jgi:putative FmdB family regulatory protein
MPIYDYMCKTCGPFTALMPMADFELDLACPECGAAAPRALLTVPHVSKMDSGRKKAFATNEKAAHAPQTTATTGRHPPSCVCCKPGTKRQADSPAAMKTFTGSRPWMISH